MLYVLSPWVMRVIKAWTEPQHKVTPARSSMGSSVQLQHASHTFTCCLWSFSPRQSHGSFCHLLNILAPLSHFQWDLLWPSPGSPLPSLLPQHSFLVYFSPLYLSSSSKLYTCILLTYLILIFLLFLFFTISLRPRTGLPLRVLVE